jgi:hypothetical protein
MRRCFTLREEMGASFARTWQADVQYLPYLSAVVRTTLPHYCSRSRRPHDYPTRAHMIQYQLEYPASDQKPVKRISAYSGPFNMHAILRASVSSMPSARPM